MFYRSITMAHLIAFLFILLPAVLAQKCTHGQYERLYVVSYTGPPLVRADRVMMSDSLGRCGTLDELAENMIQFFESWGVDVRSRKKRLFEVIEDHQVTIAPVVAHPDGSFRVTVGSNFNYAKVINAPLTITEWGLNTKANITGPRGSLTAGMHIAYGMFRFEEDGQSVCIEFFRENARRSSSPPNFQAPVNLELNTTDWKHGIGKGLGILYLPNKDMLEVEFVMKFPGMTI